MKKNIILLLLIFLSITSFSQEFLGIKVDGKMNDVVEKFKQKGFKVINDGIPVISMEGIIENKKLEIYIVCTPKTNIVWKITEYLPEQTLWNSLKKEYYQNLELLIKKYGEPSNEVKSFLPPYKEGDGNEMSHVANNLVLYMANWSNDKVLIEITKYKQVKITYRNNINARLNATEKLQ